MKFSYLDKADKAFWLPQLFDLLYENMRSVAPTDLPYEKEKQAWLKEVSPALEKAPRQIILCFDQDALIGYVQYYTREQLLMVEELQLKKQYRQTTVFFSLCRYLLRVMPQELLTMEAYADKRNHASIRLMEKLGMMPCETQQISPFVHMRGSIDNIRRLLR